MRFTLEFVERFFSKKLQRKECALKPVNSMHGSRSKSTLQLSYVDDKKLTDQRGHTTLNFKTDINSTRRIGNLRCTKQKPNPKHLPKTSKLLLSESEP